MTTIDGTERGALSASPAEVLVELRGVLRARLSIESRQSPLMVTRALVYGFHEPAVRFDDRTALTSQPVATGSSSHAVFQDASMAAHELVADTDNAHVEAVLVRLDRRWIALTAQSLLASYADLFAPSQCSAKPCRASPTDRLAPASYRVWATSGEDTSPHWVTLHRTCAQLYN